MTHILLRLQKKIPAETAEIFRHISETSATLNIRPFVIGATARDLIFEYVYDAGIRRATEDVDFAIAVESWAQYEALRAALVATGKFRLDTKREQRIWWSRDSGEMRIDLVPYGGLESNNGEIVFPPPGDFVMSTLGFREASENLLQIQIAPDLVIDTVSLAGLVLLKFIAYHDRPAERLKDIQDIWFVADNFMHARNDDRLYEEDSDLLDDEDFDYKRAGARMLGRDLHRLLTADTRVIVLSILGDTSDKDGIYRLSDIVLARELKDGDKYDEITAMFREIRKGVIERPGTDLRET